MDKTATAVLLLIEEQATEAEGEDVRTLVDVEVVAEVTTERIGLTITTRELRSLVESRR